MSFVALNPSYVLVQTQHSVNIMPVIIKMRPAAPAPDRQLKIEKIWNYRKQSFDSNDEAFVWFTRGDQTEGLAMRGILRHIAPAGTSSNYRQLVSLQIDITETNPHRPLTVSVLRAYKGSSEPGPLPKLARKLLTNSHQKVIRLEDDDEIQYLQTFFNEPPTGLSEQDWQNMEEDASLATRSQIGNRTRRHIDHDLTLSAMEGLTQEQRRILRARAAGLAERFARQRQSLGNLRCDHCDFDPSSRTEGTGVNPRSLMDVHHRDPLAEGVRVTTLSDFELLCSICHRFVHAMLRIGQANRA
jgi:predicted HNH restriction endonuclease